MGFLFGQGQQAGEAGPEPTADVSKGLDLGDLLPDLLPALVKGVGAGIGASAKAGATRRAAELQFPGTATSAGKDLAGSFGGGPGGGTSATPNTATGRRLARLRGKLFT